MERIRAALRWEDLSTLPPQEERKQGQGQEKTALLGMPGYLPPALLAALEKDTALRLRLLEILEAGEGA